MRLLTSFLKTRGDFYMSGLPKPAVITFRFLMHLSAGLPFYFAECGVFKI